MAYGEYNSKVTLSQVMKNASTIQGAFADSISSSFYHYIINSAEEIPCHL